MHCKHTHSRTHTHARLIPLLTLAKHFNRRPSPCSLLPAKQDRQLKVVIAVMPAFPFCCLLLIALSGFPTAILWPIKNRTVYNNTMKIKSAGSQPDRPDLANSIGIAIDINQSHNHLINYSKSHSACGEQLRQTQSERSQLFCPAFSGAPFFFFFGNRLKKLLAN